MSLKVDLLALDARTADPDSPAAGEIWHKDNLKPAATQAASGFMLAADKLKLDNMSANGSGDDWCTGLLVEAQSSNDRTVKYTAGTYMINGVMYAVASGGNYNLENGFDGVNHYTALSASQRAVVLLYVDSAQVIKSVSGAASSSVDPPMPTIPADTACLAFVLISKHSNGNAKNITPSNITDARWARRAHVDESTKVSSNDITSGFLRDKLTDNGNVKFTKENADANETLQANVALSSFEATATSNATTTSTSYTLMTGMTLTPGAGTYLAMFSSSLSNSAGNGNVYCCLYAAGTQIAATESVVSTFKGDDVIDTALQKVVTVTAAQAIEVKWKVGSGTGTARARVLTLIKIG
jgi:hypothetical protein